MGPFVGCGIVSLVGLGWQCMLSCWSPGSASAQFCLSQEECGRLVLHGRHLSRACVRTTRNCGDLNFQCTADSCNESQNRCVHTVVAGIACEDFAISLHLNDKCTAQGECKGVVTPPLACEIDVDCPRDLGSSAGSVRAARNRRACRPCRWPSPNPHGKDPYADAHGRPHGDADSDGDANVDGLAPCHACRCDP
jgi:hypothetical protein